MLAPADGNAVGHQPPAANNLFRRERRLVGKAMSQERRDVRGTWDAVPCDWLELCVVLVLVSQMKHLRRLPPLLPGHSGSSTSLQEHFYGHITGCSSSSPNP
ncbi:Hypothetical protein NTJ_06686 [Nesidiocoris tenuis]|uniref:Uncharacterized protein n=1 Tax=Nesidiocoris tenuis TaxID=355587 RepID=A0ABN7ATY1_9HEMI|nr:Hypothetical protein NTJ_06686 [Nesidiocoris tenuis]